MLLIVNYPRLLIFDVNDYSNANQLYTHKMYLQAFAVRIRFECAAQHTTQKSAVGFQNNVLRFRRFRFEAMECEINRKQKLSNKKKTLVRNRPLQIGPAHVYMQLLPPEQLHFGPHEQGMHRILVFGWFKIKWCSFVFLMVESNSCWKANRMRCMLCRNGHWTLFSCCNCFPIALVTHANCNLRFRTRFTFNFYYAR